MGKFKVLFGVKKGNPSWNEDVLLEGNTNLNNDKILKFAKNKYKNYGKFRILIDDGKMPDFSKVVR